MRCPSLHFTRLTLSGVLVFLAGCGSTPVIVPNKTISVTTSAPQLVAAKDQRFLYEGRFDFSDPASPPVVWQGSRISLDFSGSALTVRFGPSVEQNFFNLTVDAQTEIIAVPAGAGGSYVWPKPLGDIRHRLILFKRTEAAKGQVRFLGVELAGGAQAWAPAPSDYHLKMEFFGDSVMVGACNEDGATDQWETLRTHNNALSYPALTSAAFRADYRCMAVSGMGISTGYVDVKAGQVWDKLYPRADSPRADLKAWQPNVALVNYGENDDSFTRNQQQPFPTDYAGGYVALIKAIRAAYPHTHLVLMRGGMFGGAKSPVFRAAWEAAVQALESKDLAISHFVFTHWSANHPRVSDHRAMADELTAWLKVQPFMQRFL